jgi:predicted Rossmann fold nucleotide-binding protein DprA/Smf involved in DNA uptake
LLLIHHTRKSGGEDGEELRGSSAVAANADIILSFKRHKTSGDNARLIEATSRYEETPRKLVVSLEEGIYRPLGTPTEVAHRKNRERVLAVAGSEPLTYEELAKGADMPKATVQRVANEFYAEGILQREGGGKKGDPYRFSRYDSEDQEFDSNHSNQE